jgi:hypothetical protein
LTFFFVSWIKYQQATSRKILTSNKQQAKKRRAGTSARPGKAERPEATSTCAYKIYLIK